MKTISKNYKLIIFPRKWYPKTRKFWKDPKIWICWRNGISTSCENWM